MIELLPYALITINTITIIAILWFLYRTGDVDTETSAELVDGRWIWDEQKAYIAEVSDEDPCEEDEQ